MSEDTSFHLNSEKEEAAIRLYIDEIKMAEDRNLKKWIYIGVIAVEEDHRLELLNQLNQHDCYLHFEEIRKKSDRSPNLAAARKYLDLAFSDNSKFKFRILGLAMDRLNPSAFGDEKVPSRAYHRFMRSTILALINGIFHESRYSKVQVLEIVHDRTHHAKHWETLPIKQIAKDHSRIDFKTDRIRFINSNHKAEDGCVDSSRFLQLIDLILGTFRYVLDGPQYSRNKGAESLADSFHDFVRRVNDPNKRFKYKNHCGISYFPKLQLSDDELSTLKRYNDSFFNSKEVLWSPRGALVQTDLFAL
jgi:hypothetical protein